MRTITLEEDVSIDTIKTFYQQMTDAMDCENEIELDFARVRSADISLRLVLVTCCKRARKRNISISMKNLSPSLREIIRTEGTSGGGSIWAGF